MPSCRHQQVSQNQTSRLGPLEASGKRSKKPLLVAIAAARPRSRGLINSGILGLLALGFARCYGVVAGYRTGLSLNRPWLR